MLFEAVKQRKVNQYKKISVSSLINRAQKRATIMGQKRRDAKKKIFREWRRENKKAGKQTKLSPEKDAIMHLSDIKPLRKGRMSQVERNVKRGAENLKRRRQIIRHKLKYPFSTRLATKRAREDPRKIVPVNISANGARFSELLRSKKQS